MIEPTHDLKARDTSVSKAEGRLKVDVAGKKRRYLKKIIKKYKK